MIQAGNKELSEEEVDFLVQTRLGRQALLSRYEGPVLAAIIDEMVLRRPVGEPGVMRDQLRHLLNAARRSRIDLRVVPFSVGAYCGLEGPAMIMEFPNQPTLVAIEVRGASGLLEEPPVIRRVKLAWQQLRAVSLPPEDSARLIATIAGEEPP